MGTIRRPSRASRQVRPNSPIGPLKTLIAQSQASSSAPRGGLAPSLRAGLGTVNANATGQAADGPTYRGGKLGTSGSSDDAPTTSLKGMLGGLAGIKLGSAEQAGLNTNAIAAATKTDLATAQQLAQAGTPAGAAAVQAAQQEQLANQGASGSAPSSGGSPSGGGSGSGDSGGGGGSQEPDSSGGGGSGGYTAGGGSEDSDDDSDGDSDDDSDDMGFDITDAVLGLTNPLAIPFIATKEIFTGPHTDPNAHPNAQEVPAPAPQATSSAMMQDALNAAKLASEKATLDASTANKEMDTALKYAGIGIGALAVGFLGFKLLEGRQPRRR